MRAAYWLLPLASAACAHGARPGPTLAPEQVLAQARAEFRAGKFTKALVTFRRVQFELPPNDPALPEVHYAMAESEFQSGQLVDAAHDFHGVADQYPGSAYAAVSLLRAGDANMRLWRNPELDPSYGEAALAIYQDLAGRYPDSDAAARAQLHVRALRNWFADKAYKNGIFYFKRRAWDSGIIYFKDIVANYPEAARAPDALLRLVDTYRAIGYKEELQEACAHLRRFYPQAAGIDKSCPPERPAPPSSSGSP
ncbi:MAG TPA: outer membrane protein assembly factor BamD [Gemmatimonadales bacterium]|nr:outer membrane protein assembly factor BamD [Gemmatimonadales bacterium]